MPKQRRTEKKRKNKKTAPKLHHNVYVVELKASVLERPKFLKANPDRDPDLECFYVGRTGLKPEERFENHKNGKKSSSLAHRHALRLRPDLYDEYNPMTYDDAVKMEVELAEKLRAKGHGVWQK